MLYGLSVGMGYARILQLAGLVAACKCTELGARPGLPRRSNIKRGMLSGCAEFVECAANSDWESE